MTQTEEYKTVEPADDETRDEFVSRCMDAESERFPDEDQRLAVCFSKWENTGAAECVVCGAAVTEAKRSCCGGCGSCGSVRSGRGRITEVKRNEVVGGAPVGKLAGYFSTWEPDTGGKYGVPDQFMLGCWEASLAEHRSRGNRQIRLKDGHGRTVGGIPIDTVRVDSHGLYGEAHLNLESPAGKELYSLARQGVITDFSVGYTVVRDRIEEGPGGKKVRRIYEATLWEVSLVDEPANRGARVTEVRRAQSRTEEKLSTLLEELRGARDDLRGTERSRIDPLTAILKDLHGARDDLRGMTDELSHHNRQTIARTLDQRKRDQSALLGRINDALAIARRR